MCVWWFERWNSAKQRLNNNVDLNVVQKWHWIKGRKEKPMKIGLIWKFCASDGELCLDWMSYSWKMKVVLHPTSIDFMEFAQLLSLTHSLFFFYHLFSHHRLQRILWHSTKWLKGCTPLTYPLCEFFVQCLPFLWTLAMILVSTTSHCWNHPRRVIFCFDIFFSFHHVLSLFAWDIVITKVYGVDMERVLLETLYTKCNLWSNIKMSIEQVCE